MTVAALLDVVHRLTPIGLYELQEAADLQTRLDRKYIVEPSLVADLVAELTPSMRALSIDGRRDFSYESVYFDTPALESYFGSAYGRRRRFKVRTRSYLDSGSCVLEVKTAGGRGHTVKERLDYELERRAELDDTARCFLLTNNIPASVSSRLSPTMTTGYQRTTLLNDDGARFTIDSELVCGAPDGSLIRLTDRVLVETKSPGAVTTLDRLLWQRGIRPISVSKYCTGLAALRPELPSNKWHRTLRTHFGRIGLAA